MAPLHSFRLSKLRTFIVLVSFSYAGHTLATPPSTSAYVTDKQHSFVQDQTSEAINQVNQIACFMSNMKPADMVNQGSYIALVNKKACDSSSRSDSSGSSDSSSGGNQIDYMRAIVNVTRSDNSSPMRGKVWVENEEDGHTATIFVNVSATQAPTSSNPYGTFRMDYAAPNPLGSGSPMMQGFIDASDTGLTFIDKNTRSGSGGSSTEEIKLVLHSNGTLSGSGAATLPDHSGGGALAQKRLNSLMTATTFF